MTESFAIVEVSEIGPSTGAARSGGAPSST